MAKGKKQYFSVRTADMKKVNGWDSAGLQRVEYFCGRKGNDRPGNKENGRACGKRCGFTRGSAGKCVYRGGRPDPDGDYRAGPRPWRRIVQGSLVLVGGDPGIGKSTLLLQMCQKLAQKEKKILYISGEESLKQIRLRANRMGEFPGNLYLLCETNLEMIRSVIEQLTPDLVVIDSIQTMYHEEVSSAPGSVSQVRESTNVFLQLAKGLNIAIFLVGHVTKEGTVAGPRVLEHMVDTVLYFEGDRHASYRILRGVKNRFGSTNEIGVFEMRKEGLTEVENPSEYMLSGRPENASGSVVACAMEGTRPILMEIQALVCRSNFGMPRRTAAGLDYNRVNLLMQCWKEIGSSVV